MIFASSTRFRRRRAASTAAVIVTALAILASTPLRAQAPPTPPEDCTPGQLVDFCTAIPSDLPPGRGFLLDKGIYRTVEAPDAALTTVYDINNCGQMVGTYVDAAGPTAGGFTHGFLLEDGVFTTIDVPGIDVPDPLETEIFGINDRGQMVGLFVDAQGILTAFLRDRNGVVTEVAHPDATPPSGAPSPFGTIPFGINKHSQIVGAFR